MKKKVVLIVDNPKRDLNGLTLLAYNLVKLNYAVYLVPMYDQEIHVYSIKPDFILLNYCRLANSKRIKKYSKCGFKLGVLDTEGGILRDVYNELLFSVEKSGVIELINLYLLWGNEQYIFFKNYYFDHNIFTTNIVETGHPRFDLYHKTFHNFSKGIKPDILYEKYTLIIASFSLANPKFVSQEQEVINMHTALNYDIEYVKKMQDLQIVRLHDYLKLIKKLLKRYPNEKFVLRPHPFEKIELYQNEMKEFKNIIITSDGEIISVLSSAEIVIQVNSSVAFEAVLLGKQVLTPDYLQNKADKVDVTRQISILADNEDDFFSLFENLIHAEDIPFIRKCNTDITLNINRILKQYFHKIDGNSSLRCCNAIDSFMSEKHTKQHTLYAVNRFVLSHLWYISKTLVKFIFFRRRFELRASKKIEIKKVFDLIRYIDLNKNIKIEHYSKFKFLNILKSDAIRFVQKCQ